MVEELVMPGPDYCMGCDNYVDRTEILKYDEHGRGTVCELCATEEEIEAIEAEWETLRRETEGYAKA